MVSDAADGLPTHLIGDFAVGAAFVVQSPYVPDPCVVNRQRRLAPGAGPPFQRAPPLRQRARVRVPRAGLIRRQHGLRRRLWRRRIIMPVPVEPLDTVQQLEATAPGSRRIVDFSALARCATRRILRTLALYGAPRWVPARRAPGVGMTCQGQPAPPLLCGRLAPSRRPVREPVRDLSGPPCHGPHADFHRRREAAFLEQPVKR